MRRNIKSLFKFIFLSGATIGFTIILFKLLRNVDSVKYDKLIALDANEPMPVPPAPLNIVEVFNYLFIIFVNKFVLLAYRNLTKIIRK